MKKARSFLYFLAFIALLCYHVRCVFYTCFGGVMKAIVRFFKSFTVWDACLWGASVTAILLSFFLCQNTDYIQLTTSLIGACSLILISKGNVGGQILAVAFSVFYGTVSFFFRYYGEMITYLCMTAPIAIASIITWLKHPYQRENGEAAEVKVNRLKRRDYILMIPLSLAVTVIFYFILRAFHTANLIVSTVSILTSFLAMYLSMRRSPLYALAYAVNDIVLIVLWTLATFTNKEYISMIVCFSVFLLNDINGFVQWNRMKRRQSKHDSTQSNN